MQAFNMLPEQPVWFHKPTLVWELLLEKGCMKYLLQLYEALDKEAKLPVLQLLFASLVSF